jgi:ribosomal protein S18 acetylase RimI-like enzyme
MLLPVTAKSRFVGDLDGNLRCQQSSTHPDHRRRGLGKALVLRAMHQMKAAGMTHATVANSGTNEASRALYEAYGFTPWHVIGDYTKRS